MSDPGETLLCMMTSIDPSQDDELLAFADKATEIVSSIGVEVVPENVWLQTAIAGVAHMNDLTAGMVATIKAGKPQGVQPLLRAVLDATFTTMHVYFGRKEAWEAQFRSDWSFRARVNAEAGWKQPPWPPEGLPDWCKKFMPGSKERLGPEKITTVVSAMPFLNEDKPGMEFLRGFVEQGYTIVYRMESHLAHATLTTLRPYMREGPDRDFVLVGTLGSPAWRWRKPLGLALDRVLSLASWVIRELPDGTAPQPVLELGNEYTPMRTYAHTAEDADEPKEVTRTDSSE